MSLDVALDEIILLFESTPPPTDAKPEGSTSRGYRYLAHRSGFTGGSNDDRAFEFIGFDRDAQVELAPDGARAAYVIPVQTYLSNDGLTRRQQITRPAKELRALVRAVERSENWAHGVQAVLVEGASVFSAAGGEGDDDFPEADIIVQVDLRIEVIE